MDQVAEGINTLGLLKQEAESRGVAMPLVDGLYAILYEHRDVEASADVADAQGAGPDVEFVMRQVNRVKIMYLTIWRHGEAGDAARDRLRALTERGQEDMRRGCREFVQLCGHRGIALPDAILYSEWVRTRQTAAILSSQLPNAQSTACSALIPGRRPADVDAELELICGAEPRTHLLLVSHQPLVSALVDHYVGETNRVPALMPGAFATLDIDVLAPGCGAPRFCAQPPSYESIT